MTVGEVMALLCKQASDEDMYLMKKSVYSIDVFYNGIRLYFTDGENTDNYFIKKEREGIEKYEKNN